MCPSVVGYAIVSVSVTMSRPSWCEFTTAILSSCWFQLCTVLAESCVFAGHQGKAFDRCQQTYFTTQSPNYIHSMEGHRHILTAMIKQCQNLCLNYANVHFSWPDDEADHCTCRHSCDLWVELCTSSQQLNTDRGSRQHDALYSFPRCWSQCIRLLLFYSVIFSPSFSTPTNSSSANSAIPYESAVCRMVVMGINNSRIF